MVDTHRKGSTWQRSVVVWLEAHDFRTSVRGIGYTGDDVIAERGELAFSVECKNQREIRLARFVDQAVANAGDSIPLTVIHRLGRASVDDAYVVVRGVDFLRLMPLMPQTAAATCNNPQHVQANQRESRPHARDHKE